MRGGSPVFGTWLLDCGLEKWQCLLSQHHALDRSVSEPQLHRVGIFIEMAMEIISFYHVSDASHIFTLTKMSAPEPLHPFFSPANWITDDQGFQRICPLMSLGNVNHLPSPRQGT